MPNESSALASKRLLGLNCNTSQLRTDSTSKSGLSVSLKTGLTGGVRLNLRRLSRELLRALQTAAATEFVAAETP